jgi:hypothetical protein
MPNNLVLQVVTAVVGLEVGMIVWSNGVFNLLTYWIR